VFERGFLNRRRAQRARVTLPASIVTISTYQYFELVDLSGTGAKLRGSKIPELGKTALFRLDGFQALCRVVWCDDEICGVHFEEVIPSGVLARLRLAGDAAEIGFVVADDQHV